jgi:hypothetical protein
MDDLKLANAWLGRIPTLRPLPTRLVMIRNQAKVSIFRTISNAMQGPHFHY